MSESTKRSFELGDVVVPKKHVIATCSNLCATGFKVYTIIQVRVTEKNTQYLLDGEYEYIENDIILASDVKDYAVEYLAKCMSNVAKHWI